VGVVVEERAVRRRRLPKPPGTVVLEGDLE